MPRPIRMVIADDHEIFRNGFKLLFKNQGAIELVGEAEDGQHLLEVVEKTKPDIVVTDIKMPRLDGVEATRILKEKFPALGIIALSMFNDDNLIVDMLEAGARGYLLKNTKKEELLQAAKAVYKGGSYYCDATSQKLTQLIFDSAYNPYKYKKIVLTPKEKEIVILICQQYGNKEIADKLDLKVRTIESYREKIQKKIGARNMVGVVMYAVKTKLFSLETSS